MDKLSPKQEQILKEFREKVIDKIPPHWNTDIELSRWLAARNFNIDKAQAMLFKSLEFRKEWKIDDIIDWAPPEVLRKYYPVGIAGNDKEGAPVIILPYGNIDIRGLRASSNKDDIIRYLFQVFEKTLKMMRERSRDTRKPIGKEILIADLENFSLRDFTWKPALNIILKQAKMLDAHYPEILKYLFVVNAPKSITVVMSVLKPIIHANTMKRIRIYGKSGWKEALLEEIDADQLPVHWGGTMTDPDGNTKCVSKISIGGPVPKQYYLKNEVLKLQNQNLSHDFKNSVSLSKNETEIFEFHSGENVGTELRWEFRSTGSDIAYEVSRIINNEEEKLIPMQRTNSLVSKEEGTLLCDEEGLYKIVFKNEYSDGKVEVYYNAGLHLREEQSS